MSYETLRKQFWEQGYVLLENFFGDEELVDVMKSLEQYQQRIPDKASTQYGNRPAAFETFETKIVSFSEEAFQDPAFHKFGINTKLEEVTLAIIGEGYFRERPMVMFSTKGNGQAWHRDCHHENPKHFIINRLIYTQDLDPEVGALYVVPGSHKRDQFPPGGLHDPIEGELMIVPKKGTLALVHSSTFHRVHRNETNRPRCSINYRVRPKGAPEGLTKVGIYRTGAWDFSQGKPVSDVMNS